MRPASRARVVDAAQGVVFPEPLGPSERRPAARDVHRYAAKYLGPPESLVGVDLDHRRGVHDSIGHPEPPAATKASPDEQIAVVRGLMARAKDQATRCGSVPAAEIFVGSALSFRAPPWPSVVMRKVPQNDTRGNPSSGHSASAHGCHRARTGSPAFRSPAAKAARVRPGGGKPSRRRDQKAATV
jgi:hypothetical protein